MKQRADDKGAPADLLLDFKSPRLYNLLSNTIKYASKENNITVTMTQENEAGLAW